LFGVILLIFLGYDILDNVLKPYLRGNYVPPGPFLHDAGLVSGCVGKESIYIWLVAQIKEEGMSRIEQLCSGGECIDLKK